MNALLLALLLALGSAVFYLIPDYGAGAVLTCYVAAGVAAFFIYRSPVDKKVLLYIFAAGLIVRMALGTAIYMAKLQEFFGGDAITYDGLGYDTWLHWERYGLSALLDGAGGVSGWGMLYIVAAIYGAVGRNMLAVQYFNAVLGAATAPVIYLCAHHLFGNLRVARLSALLVAFFPSLILWSAQGLKDAPIVFLLALSILATLKLTEKYSTTYLVVLVISLSCVLTLRFYVFYMLVAAIGGSILIGARRLAGQSVARQLMIIGVAGLAMTYLGVLRTASERFETYGSLEAVQRSRFDLAISADSGFGRDVDVSTTSGAITVIPVGMTYLLFAPFPWQIGSLRQNVTFPEMVVWWGLFPFLVLGLYFTVKHRLRQAMAILIFTTMLTLAYSVFQGNVGTAYRQRAQLLVFYFIFVSVGVVLVKEKSEENRRQALIARQAVLKGIGRGKGNRVGTQT